eukprot:2028413-Alexandrium_andersonii.AAC.1
MVHHPGPLGNCPTREEPPLCTPEQSQRLSSAHALHIGEFAARANPRSGSVRPLASPAPQVLAPLN